MEECIQTGLQLKWEHILLALLAVPALLGLGAAIAGLRKMFTHKLTFAPRSQGDVSVVPQWLVPTLLAMLTAVVVGALTGWITRVVGG